MSKQFTLYSAEAYSEPCKHLRWSFVKKVNDFQSLTIFAKSSILNVWLGSEYASEEAATGGVL